DPGLYDVFNGSTLLSQWGIGSFSTVMVTMVSGGTVIIQSAPSGVPVHVNIGDGNLDDFAGAATVDGSGSGTILVNANDQAAPFGDAYDITASTLSRPYFGGLTYSGLAGLTLNAETGSNTINIHSTSAPLTVNDDAGSDTVNVGDPGLAD